MQLLCASTSQPMPLRMSTTADNSHGVLNALSDAGHRMLASMLEGGEWKVEGNELID